MKMLQKWASWNNLKLIETFCPLFVCFE